MFNNIKKNRYPDISIKNNAALLFEWLILTICIFTGAYLNSDGFLTPDSTNYLALAQSLIDGNGLYVSGYGYSGNEKDFFAIWPAGYPLLIAVIEKITGLSVFWSSKMLNALLAGATLLLLKKAFKQNAYVYGLLLFTGASITILTYTWSENLFITALIGFSIALNNFIQSKHNSLPNILTLMFFSLLAFSARYIGAFTIIIMIITSMNLLVKHDERFKGSVLFIASCAITIIIYIYLKNNLELTGYMTGRPRTISPESNLTLTIQLIIALLAEIIFPIPVLAINFAVFLIVIIQCIILRLSLKNTFIEKPKTFSNKKTNNCLLSTIFTLIGLIYLACIISMRWITHFDDFSFRLLFPGTLLIFIGLIRHIEIHHANKFQKLTKALLLLSILTINLAIIFSIFTSKEITYPENIRKITEKYAAIPNNSIMVFGNMHLKYLRSDLLLWNPLSLPYNDKKETWEDFNHRAGNNRKIFLEKPENINKDNFDSSVIEIINQYDHGIIYPLR